MSEEDNTKKRRRPVQLPKEFKDGAGEIFWALDFKPDGGYSDRYKIHLDDRDATSLKALINSPV